MTITTINNAVNLGGTTTLLGNSSSKTTLQVGTTAVILNAQISAWAEQQGQQTQRESIRIYYAISPFSVTAAAGMTTLLRQSGQLTLTPQTTGITVDTTGGILNNGGFLYTWFDSPAMSPNGTAAPTLTLTSVELP